MREVIFIGIKYFLGANSGEGFYSLYDSFARNDGDLLYLIKGGPGCGKSGFMRKITEKAQGLGYEVEEILCSGDPDSLDAVYIPEIKTAFCDATAPHAAEPRLFAVDSYYVNLGQFCSLSENSKIAEYSKKYKQMYKSAYSYLSPLAGLKRAEIPDLYGQNEIRIAKSRAKSAVIRNVSKLSSCTPKSSFRFIHCISCLGELCLEESLSELCKQIYLIDDRLGLADTYLKAVIETAKRRCGELIVCPSPLLTDMTEAVILPEQALGYISSSVMKPVKPYRLA